MDEKNVFSQMDFGPLSEFLEDDDVTDISYSNAGQVWLKTLSKGVYQVERPDINNPFMEKLAFQCANVMGRTFNMAHPFLDSESAELRMNFVHESIATNGIACLIRKTPAKIRLNKDKLLDEQYITDQMHDFLIKCVWGHCNILVAGETGSGKTELVKYLSSNTKENEKIISIEDTLELHLDKIFPQRDIVSMKTNNVASYSDVLVTCMRQNPKWILLSEVRSAEAVSAVRNSISSGHNILSTIHADKASAIPYRLYSLMETDLDVHQFLTTIYRYIQLGVHIKAFYSKEYGKFHRELDEVAEFYVDDNNVPKSRIIYQKVMGHTMMCKPSAHMIEYLSNQNIDISDIIKDLPDDLPIVDGHVDLDEYKEMMGISDEDTNVGEANKPLEKLPDDEKKVEQSVPQIADVVTTDGSEPQVVETPAVEVVQPQVVEAPVLATDLPQVVETPAVEVAQPQVVEAPVLATDLPQVVETPAVYGAQPQVVEVPTAEVAQPQVVESPVVTTAPQQVVETSVVVPGQSAAAIPTASNNGLPLVNPVPNAPVVIPGTVA